MKHTSRKILSILVIMLISSLALAGCGKSGGSEKAGETAVTEPQIEYRYASADEAGSLMMANENYYAGFSQNDLDYRMGKTGATMEEYKAFAVKQTRDFTQEEKAEIDKVVAEMERTLADNGLKLPPLDEIVLIKTTMEEECGAGGYTHGTQIYLSEELIQVYAADPDDEENAVLMKKIMWHELSHCLTRCNPEYRAELYKLIHFTVQDKDYELPPKVAEYHISNPDVEHHDSYATFIIDGKETDCFTDFVTTKHFEKEGDMFFDYGTTALVPTDGSDTFYTPDQTENFDEIFGTNTDYVIDPEECMADNFAYAMMFGMEGPGGEGYPNPEIIEGILKLLGNK